MNALILFQNFVFLFLEGLALDYYNLENGLPFHLGTRCGLHNSGRLHFVVRAESSGWALSPEAESSTISDRCDECRA